MTKENANNNHDKGFWIQITLGIAVVVLIFMYIQSMAVKPDLHKAAKAPAAAKMIEHKPVVAKAPETATPPVQEVSPAPSQADSTPVAPAETAQVVSESSPAPVAEAPVVETPVVETAAVETPAVEAPVTEVAVTEPPVTEVAVVEAAAQVSEQVPVEMPTPAPEVQAHSESSLAPQPTEADSQPVTEEAKVAEEPKVEEPLQKKAADWLSKLGFGGEAPAIEAPVTEESVTEVQAVTADAAPATEAQGSSDAVNPEQLVAAPADALDLLKAAQAESAASASAPVQTAPAAVENPTQAGAYPQVMPPMPAPMQPEANEPPAWAKERVQRVDELRAELHSAMQQMRAESMRRMEEERRQRDEQVKRDMPEWMREHISKVEQLRGELRKEMDALRQEIKDQRGQAAPMSAGDAETPAYYPPAPYYAPRAGKGYGHPGQGLRQGYGRGQGYGYPEPSYPAYPYMGR